MIFRILTSFPIKVPTLLILFLGGDADVRLVGVTDVKFKAFSFPEDSPSKNLSLSMNI